MSVGDVQAGCPLAGYSTLRLGGPARRLVVARTEDRLVEAVRATDGPLLVLAGGSNVVIGDAGFPGTVVLVRTRGIDVRAAGDRVRLTVAAGQPWDDVCAEAVTCGYSGIEALSGVPGSAGATPIQNVGAYGQEVAETITRVRVYDRDADRVVDLAPDACGFAYRTSLFKHSDRYVVLSVEFGLAPGELSAPVRYAELARTLGVAVGERAPLAEVRNAVLKLRAGKGMVLDPEDPDTWSVGSFFTNPVLDAGGFASLCERAAAAGVAGPPPAWPGGDGSVKVSAAWLIERAGFGKGYALPEPTGAGSAGAGPTVALSTKHTLALTNRGGGTTAALLELARAVRDGVADRFGVALRPEPVLVACAL